MSRDWKTGIFRKFLYRSGLKGEEGRCPGRRWVVWQFTFTSSTLKKESLRHSFLFTHGFKIRGNYIHHLVVLDSARLNWMSSCKRNCYHLRWQFIKERFKEKRKQTCFLIKKIKSKIQEKRKKTNSWPSKMEQFKKKKNASFKLLLFSFLNFLLWPDLNSSALDWKRI